MAAALDRVAARARAGGDELVVGLGGERGGAERRRELDRLAQRLAGGGALVGAAQRGAVLVQRRARARAGRGWRRSTSTDSASVGPRLAARCPSGRGSPNARARARSSSASVAASSARPSVLSRHGVGAPGRVGGRADAPGASRASPQASRSARPSSGLPVAALQAAAQRGAWRPRRGPRAGPRAGRTSCHRRSRLRRRPGRARISISASAPGRTMKLGCSAALAASASASARLPRRHHAPARRCEAWTKARNDPCRCAHSMILRERLGGLDQRAREQQRERRAVDGGDARAGVVEQRQRLQRELAGAVRAAGHRLAVGEPGDEHPLAGRRAARRPDRRSGTRPRAPAPPRCSVALRRGAADRLQQQPELALLVGQRVDRAR